MEKFAVTFGSRYNHEPHPVDPRITGKSFIVVEAYDETHARERIYALLGERWAFLYPWGEFVPQIAAYGLTEVTLAPVLHVIESKERQ